MWISIWKFSLPVADSFDLSMPEGSTVLSIQVQIGSPVLWALCDPARPNHARHFRTYGTGHQISSDPGCYVGTYQLGPFVGHVFEVT